MVVSNWELDTSSNNVEILFLKVFSSHQKLLQGVIYRPNNRINFEALLDKLTSLTLDNTYTILIGDFNARTFLDRGLAEDMGAISLHLMNDSMPMQYTSVASA